MRKILHALILLCYFGKSITASSCYSDYCQREKELTSTSGPSKCLLKLHQRCEECAGCKFKDVGVQPVQNSTAKFNFNAYTYKESKFSATAFNFSIINVDFQRLCMRYQSLQDPDLCVCNDVEFFENEAQRSFTFPKEFYISCPFSDVSFEEVPYQLNYLVIGKQYNYSKQYTFNVPKRKFMENNLSIQHYTPFVYVDVSYNPLVLLHVQPLPETYNVTKYKVWLINKTTDSVMNVSELYIIEKQKIWYNLAEYTGAFYFNVTAMHPNCGEYGCKNSTTPDINIKRTYDTFLVMIVGIAWLGGGSIIIYIIRLFYELHKMGPTCVLVYSPTRFSHGRAMSELGNYLKKFNVNVDTLEIAHATENEAEVWRNITFQKADIVLIASSPPPKRLPMSTTSHRNSDNWFLRFMKANESEFQSAEEYYTLQLSYCKPDDIPEEARQFKRFYLPEELCKLVKTIDKLKGTRHVSVSDREFLNSVKLAKVEILEEESFIEKETRETENLLALESGKLSNDRILSFATNIDELNLLGEKEKHEEMFAGKTLSSSGIFCIDELTL